MMSRFYWTMLVAFAFAACLAAADAPVQKETAQDEQEWNISADSMEMLVDKHTIEMEGNVLVEDNQVRLTAKKMVVHLDDNNKLRSIEAYGGVTVRKLDSTESATGDTGIYDAAEEMVTLSGNCILLKDKNTLTGDKVVYNRKTNVISMKRATIVIPVKKGSGGAFEGFLSNDREKKPEETQPEEKKPEEKKPEDKQPEDKQAEPK